MERTGHDLGYVKIEIRLPEGSPGGGGEWCWAEPISPFVCALRNVPFYAFGISYDDHLRVEMKDGVAAFVEVVKRGGHSTYRIYASEGRHHPKVNKALSVLHEKMKCDLEAATEELVAVDVLPEADFYGVYAFLEREKTKGLWDLQEGHCGHSLRKGKTKSHKS